MKDTLNAELRRLEEARRGAAPWRRWGSYLSERQWGTVREDYSPDGRAWDYLPHDAARSRAYRWGEDGLAGICDDRQLLCLAPAFWNGRDPILKERLFGLSNHEGNHGEDVKEVYFHIDNTPTHAYMAMLYKYPQGEFPYDRLVAENHRRGKAEPEFELLDTGIFDDDRYFDIIVEYAKAAPEDLLLRLTAHNRGPEPAPLHLIPQVWFRNTWAWDRSDKRPTLHAAGPGEIHLDHPELGRYRLYGDGEPELLFCDNDTNVRRLAGRAHEAGFFKDAFHACLIGKDPGAVNPDRTGTKAALVYRADIAPGQAAAVRLRLAREAVDRPWEEFDEILDLRRREADEFYAGLQTGLDDPDARRIHRQALAGMLWTKQFYYFDVPQWLDGDPEQPPPPPARREGRNHGWRHLNNADVISMPDAWEYPWYAAWDLAFHCVPLALLDPDFAKEQLLLLSREWYMHPNGQLPAYEWDFGDVNPPVHAWAAWRVYEMDRVRRGEGDRDFLERVFHKLLLNFTWWVNRKDVRGRNLFQGGFLGLDNIGVFDRSAPLPVDGIVEQADGTSWMAMYCLNLLRISLELARYNPVYEDMATKFFEHFLYIAAAMGNIGGTGAALWDEEDQFFYDVLQRHTPDRAEPEVMPIKVRSMVGLIPLFAVETLEPDLLEQVPNYRRRMEWFLNYRPDLASLISRWYVPGAGERRLLSLLRGHRMKRLLQRMLDPAEFLSDYGVRALSRSHLDHPYVLRLADREFTVRYEPAESTSNLFGGNSNWRGPVWMPLNYLLVESLHKFHHYYGDDFKVEHPTGSGRMCTLREIADDLARRLTGLFRPGADGRIPALDTHPKFRDDPRFREHLLFYECFHGDNGRGVGASHQTGWTGLVASLLASLPSVVDP
jgi:hypothetical protein